MKLRGVLIVLSASHGSKVNTALAVAVEMTAKGVKTSLRSLYRWRAQYLRSGFSGIARRVRDDAGFPRSLAEEDITYMVVAATWVRGYGDVMRAFRGLRTGICYETFRIWVRRIQQKLRVTEIPGRGDFDGLSF
jgi:hypothetical protein